MDHRRRHPLLVVPRTMQARQGRQPVLRPRRRPIDTISERLRGRDYDTAPQPEPTTDNAEADLT